LSCRQLFLVCIGRRSPFLRLPIAKRRATPIATMRRGDRTSVAREDQRWIARRERQSIRFPRDEVPDDRNGIFLNPGRVHQLRSTSRHNLPAPRTSFVGRERELGEIKRELEMSRLLTLTGAGGSGKTRLALEVARDLLDTYPDGVWLVELAPLSEAKLVPKAVAEAL
jgi:hypothetical protein